MAEYRSLRAKHSMLALCKTPELAAQVALQPIDRFPVDAAIIGIVDTVTLQEETTAVEVTA